MLLCTPGGALAQTVLYEVDDLGFFDNRETHSIYQRSQTLFGNRLSAAFGVGGTDGTLMAGGYIVQEFGQKKLADSGYTFYYHYHGSRFSGAFGAFPRRMLQRDLPDVFVDDSLRYYVPNIQGALIQYIGMRGSAELYCNWRNRQSYTEREIFEIVSDGEWRLYDDAFTIGYNAELTHFSVRRGTTSDKVYDKIMLNPTIGLQVALGWAVLDSLHLTAGALVSFNRDRTDKVWKTPVGFLSDVHLYKGRMVVRNRLYAGRVQYSDYTLYGRALHQGDAWYCSPFYNRLDASFYLLRRETVECAAMASLHFTKGAMDSSQSLLLRTRF